MAVATAENIYTTTENVYSVGNDIRALRKARSMTLVDFATAIDRSVGFVSQIERGLSEPSISDLRNIAKLFNVPLSFFFGDNSGTQAGARHVVRADHRRKLGNPDEGLIEELLSPDLGGSFEIIRSEFAAGANLADPQQRDTEEAGYIVSGKFELEINGEWYSLQSGDSFRFAGEPYRWRNTSSEPAIVIWVVSPQSIKLNHRFFEAVNEKIRFKLQRRCPFFWANQKRQRSNQFKARTGNG